MKRPDSQKMQQLRQELFDGIDSGNLSLGEATRKMRKSLGMTRREYAEKVLKISHDALQDVETGKGNPTLKTLQAVGKPFGLVIGFVRRPSF
ncbi:MAG: helix-turn-helix transcriptional regulator [Desulfuromusa sp.]|nr:helix-turn-helix transcriptional regulator [Desulfuromusa sp.]